MRPVSLVSWMVLGLCFAQGGWAETAAAKDIAEATLSADEAYLKARKFYGGGDFEQALKWLTYANNKKSRAFFVYQIARAQEAMGQLKAAHETYLKVIARSDARAKVRRICRVRANAIKPMLGRSMLRFKNLKEGSVVQIDERVAPELSVDAEQDPGSHQICVLAPGGTSLSCWVKELAAGTRTSWPLKSDEGTRGVLLWKGMEGVKMVQLNGKALLVDLAKLEEIEVDVGSNRLDITQSDDTKQSVTVEVVSGSPRSVQGALSGSGDVQVVGVGASSSWYTEKHWLVTGAGVAMVLGGGVMWGMSGGTRDGGRTQAETRDAWNRANTQESVGVALFGVGLATVAGGVGWWWMKRKDRSEQAAVGPEIHVGFVGANGVGFGGRF